MSTGPVEGALQQGLLRLDQSLIFGADRDFLSTLTMGQIIKGRVLRHYEGSRYGVEFGGQERVVDSAIALRSGDVIHAINGRTVKSIPQAFTAVRKIKRHDVIRVDYSRGGKQLTKTVQVI